VFVIVFCGFFSAISEATSAATLPQNVFINDVNVSALTITQAKDIVEQKLENDFKDFSLVLVYEGKDIVLNRDQLVLVSDIGDIFKKIAGDFAMSSNNILEQFNVSRNNSERKDYSVVFFLDEDAIRKSLEEVLAPKEVDSVNATVIFDKKTVTFNYKNGVVGKKFDFDDIINTLNEKISQNNFSKTKIQAIAVNPELSKEKLMEITVEIAEKTSKLSQDADANNNIELISEAVNGIIINPSETVSLNDLTGKRTEKLGYKPAFELVAEDEIAKVADGGVSQFASVFYWAALQADLEVTERNKPITPSLTVPVGLDAFINESNDLKIKNTKKYPIYISSKVSDDKITVKIFGAPNQDGYRIEIVNKIIEQTEAGESLGVSKPAGEPLIEPRKGYIVEVHREYYKDGNQPANSDLISKDNYLPINGEKSVGNNK